jgi:hypothetical protein
LLPLLGAVVLSALCLLVSLNAFRRCRALPLDPAALEDDPLERRLAEREVTLELSGSRRSVQVLGRSALFGGTGLAVLELTGGSTHYGWAAGVFVVGLVGWMVCGELERRIGSLAESWRSVTERVRRRQGVDQSPGTG